MDVMCYAFKRYLFQLPPPGELSLLWAGAAVFYDYDESFLLADFSGLRPLLCHVFKREESDPL